MDPLEEKLDDLTDGVKAESMGIEFGGAAVYDALDIVRRDGPLARFHPADIGQIKCSVSDAPERIGVWPGAEIVGGRDPESEFLPDFSYDGLFRGLVRINKAAGEVPKPLLGVVRSDGDQQPASIVLNQGTHGGGRI